MLSHLKIDLQEDFESQGQDLMDRDLELAKSFMPNDRANAIIRFYTWKPFALSLGYNQSDDKVDKDYLKQNSYDLVQRPTGGRAVFHANELTYSIIVPQNLIDKNTLYKEVHTHFAHCFSKIGIETDLTKTNPDFKNFYKSDERSFACFASAARYELSYDGKKIVGSAQRVIGENILQHGSILVSPGYEELAFMTKSSPEFQEKLLNFIKSVSISINEISDLNLSPYDLAFHLKNHILNL